MTEEEEVQVERELFKRLAEVPTERDAPGSHAEHQTLRTKAASEGPLTVPFIPLYGTLQINVLCTRKELSWFLASGHKLIFEKLNK